MPSMLRDWQLLNPTRSFFYYSKKISQLRIKAMAMAPPSLFYFIIVIFFFLGREDAFTAKFYCLSCKSPTAAAKKSFIFARPPRETPVESGDLFSSVDTGLPPRPPYVRALRLG